MKLLGKIIRKIDTLIHVFQSKCRVFFLRLKYPGINLKNVTIEKNCSIIKENESLQIEELKKILSYDNKVDKKIGDLIKEALTIDKTKTNDILKQYNKTKLNRLLVLVKEKGKITTEFI